MRAGKSGAEATALQTLARNAERLMPRPVIFNFAFFLFHFPPAFRQVNKPCGRAIIRPMMSSE